MPKYPTKRTLKVPISPLLLVQPIRNHGLGIFYVVKFALGSLLQGQTRIAKLKSAYNSISPTNEVKNLGVTFDSGDTFASYITKVCRACYYHLKDLRRIRKFLSELNAALLASSMISSRIDYCNSLLYGVNKYNVAKLQKIQNALCRIVFRLDKTSHVTPYLRKLHWLPISYRILFKYNLITFPRISLFLP